ncbi:MAG: response regulator [Flavobacteriales bacterium]|nr:response regulator [Flavobacteriales bacterium]MCB9168418.1 response regulator [Flavobacteriales bacterium]
MARYRSIHKAFATCIVLAAQPKLDAQDLRTVFTQDTTLVGAMLQHADQSVALWQLDSVSHYAGLGLARVRSLMMNDALMSDPVRRRHLLELKARCLDRLGQANRNIDDLSELAEALGIFQDLGDLTGQARVHYHYAERLGVLGDPLKAIDHKRTAIALMEQSGDTAQAAHWLNSLGVSYRVMGHPETALEYHLRVLPALQAAGDSEEIAFTHILIGAVHRSTRQWDGALHYFHIARRKYLQLRDTLGTSMAYNDLGTAWFGAGNMDSAMFWHRKAAELRSHTDYFHGIAYSHDYMAQIHQREKRYDEAIREYRIAAKYFQRVPTYSQVAGVYGDIARIHKERGEADSALATITHALNILQRFSEAMLAAPLYDLAGDIHDFRGEYAEARKAYERGLGIAQESSNLDMQVRIAKHLSELHEAHGDLHQAYLEYRTYLVARDSLQGRSGKSEVMRMMLQHNADQAEQEKERRDTARRLEQQAELRSRERHQRLYLSGGGVLVVLAIGLVGRIRFSAHSRRKLEEQRRDLEHAKHRAEQSERFKERFLANMSHEIRTPMNAIMGMTAIMRRGPQLPHQRTYLDAVAQNAEDLLHIINDILDLSKLDADRLELETTPMDPGQVVGTIAQELGPKARDKGLDLRTDLAPDLPRTVIGDPTRLRQMLMNIAENAVKYTTEGHVTIAAAPGPGTASDATIVFTVSDTGPGIPPERMDTIFEEFNKAYAYSEGHGRYGGTGLGLAISERLAALHGGTLGVESTVGKGSTFTATIPLSPAVVAHVPAPEVPGPELRDLHILVADDNEFNIMVATDELTDAIPGVRVDVARNGKEAVERALRTAYDVILMDVQMPEMNGYDATRAIREAQSHDAGMRRTPILAMTANALGSEITRCREAGMNGFVPKPFRREDLLAELRSLLDPSARA